MIELEDGRTFGAEAFLFGNYIKHNNNSGGREDREPRQAHSELVWVVYSLKG